MSISKAPSESICPESAVESQFATVASPPIGVRVMVMVTVPWRGNSTLRPNHQMQNSQNFRDGRLGHVLLLFPRGGWLPVVYIWTRIQGRVQGVVYFSMRTYLPRPRRCGAEETLAAFAVLFCTKTSRILFCHIYVPWKIYHIMTTNIMTQGDMWRVCMRHLP